MAHDTRTTIVAGATTILLGASLGVTIAPEVSQKIVEQAAFREKLKTIRQAVETGKISPLVSDGEQWLAAHPRKVNVAEWLQTWNKPPVDNFGKV